MTAELTVLKLGNLKSSFPNLVGWFGYCDLQYSSRAHWDFSWIDSIWATSLRPHASVVNNTIAFKQEYSAESTWRAFNFSTCSWNILIWSINCTTRSAHIGEACNPAAAIKGATWSGIEHWLAFKTNSSDHTSLSKATWSVTCRSGKKGIFLAHSTAEKSKRAASSQMFSIPIILFACMHCPYLVVG